MIMISCERAFEQLQVWLVRTASEDWKKGVDEFQLEIVIRFYRSRLDWSTISTTYPINKQVVTNLWLFLSRQGIQLHNNVKFEVEFKTKKSAFESWNSCGSVAVKVGPLLWRMKFEDTRPVIFPAAPDINCTAKSTLSNRWWYKGTDGLGWKLSPVVFYH